MPIGIPGCPDLACSTASMARARIALAMLAWAMAGAAGACSRRSGGTAAAVEEAFALMRGLSAGGYHVSPLSQCDDHRAHPPCTGMTKTAGQILRQALTVWSCST